MSSDLITIGRSGAAAARAALDVAAQNIANANSENYSRRSLTLAEVSTTGSVAYYASNAHAGVRVEQVRRTDSVWLQNEARRTASDLARADAELSGLRGAENAVEQAGIYSALVEFEASLGALRADPLSEALRAAVLEQGRAVADTLRLSAGALEASGAQLRFEAQAGVETVNNAAQELARINTALVRTQPGTTGFANLLDRRDAQLAALSAQIGISVSYQPNGVASVRIGDASGPLLVDEASTAPYAMSTNADGTVAFTLGGASAGPASGALAGKALALTATRDLGAELDALAVQLVTTVNAAQASGVDPAGAPGQPFFSGTDAASIAVTLASGSGIATAPAGAPAGSRETGNLDALRSALANGGPTSAADRMLFTLAGKVGTREVTRDALASLAESASIALLAESGVDLDAEAANLVRYQQAFQASGRVIQTAADIFDTILGIR
jgi:flagellar hook-associated protein 1 FlgK